MLLILSSFRLIFIIIKNYFHYKFAIVLYVSHVNTFPPHFSFHLCTHPLVLSFFIFCFFFFFSISRLGFFTSWQRLALLRNKFSRVTRGSTYRGLSSILFPFFFFSVLYFLVFFFLFLHHKPPLFITIYSRLSDTGYRGQNVRRSFVVSYICPGTCQPLLNYT